MRGRRRPWAHPPRVGARPVRRRASAHRGWPLGERFEVDHIVPVAAGGSSDPENLRALHQECHRQAGAARGVRESPPGRLQDRGGALDFSRGQDGLQEVRRER